MPQPRLYNRPLLKIVDRLLLIELRGPFFFGVAMFSLLTIATIVLQEAARFVIRYNLPAGTFFTLLLFASPQFVVLSIPMGVLLGTLLSAGRLSADQEITALRACGISIYRVLAPYAAVGLLLSGLTFYGSERLVPYCNNQLKELKNKVVAGTEGRAKQQRVSWPIRDRGDLRWLLVANEVEGPRLNSVKLFYFDPRSENRDFYITASHAVWQGDDWTFFDMRQVMLRPGEEPQVLTADSARVPGFSITPQSLGLRAKTPEDLNIRELTQVIADLLKKGEQKASDTEILDFRTKLYFKYSIPLTPLFFIFIALPLAIIPQRASSAMGTGLALLVVLLYYIVYTMCQKLGAAGVLPPLAAAWVPNAALLAIGAVLLQRREHS